MRWIRRHLLAFAALAVLAYLLLPNVVVAVFSFNNPSGRYNYEWTRFSTQAWQHPCGTPGICDSLGLTNNDQLMASKFSVICGLTYNFLPFMTLPLYASLERVDQRLLEAAGDLYSSPFTAFRKITLPLSMPGLVAGTLLTFIPACGDYINSKLLGSTNTTMIGQVIDGQFLRVLDYPTAAALSFALMITIVVLVAVYVRRAGTEELV
jgi:spermidine/putrescine transport system permease protein